MKHQSYLHDIADLLQNGLIDIEGNSLVTIVLDGADQAVITEKVLFGADKGRVFIYKVKEEYDDEGSGMSLVFVSEVKPLSETLIADVTKTLELSHEQHNIG